MKIAVCPSCKKGKHIRVPNWLILNAITAYFLARRMKKHPQEKTLNAHQLRLLFRTIRKEAKRLKGSWQFVDVITHEDTHITICM